MTEILVTNARIATMVGDDSYGLIDPGGIEISDGKISWIGSMDEMRHTSKAEPIDCNGKLITPGLIDCHTHLVYGGDRAGEFEQRLEGVSYADVAKTGGGIVSTVNATRATTEDELFDQSLPRLQRIMSEGVTTVEIKSGYGLDSTHEIKMLQVAKRLAEHTNVRVQKTFLGAHAISPEYAGRGDDYIGTVCNRMLPQAHEAGVVDAVDAFIENIAFSVAQIERVFDVAQSFGLPIKAHAEQLSDQGGAVMAAKRNALSVDHLEYLRPEDVGLLSENNTVAVLLPGAFYVLRERQLPPVGVLRDHQVPIAIATDCNPGSSPVTSLLLTMNMACTLFNLTPKEALLGATRNAARALGVESEVGTLEVGKFADLVVWNIQNPAELSYNIGLNPCAAIMIGGQWTRPFNPDS